MPGGPDKNGRPARHGADPTGAEGFWNVTREEQLELVRKHYSLNAAGDIAAAEELLTDDFFITIPSCMPFGGTYRGKGAFRELIPTVRDMAAVAGLRFLGTTTGDDQAIEICEFTLKGDVNRPTQVAELIRFRGN